MLQKNKKKIIKFKYKKQKNLVKKKRVRLKIKKPLLRISLNFKKFNILSTSKRSYKKHLKWQSRKKKRKVLRKTLKNKIIFFKKCLYYRKFAKTRKYIVRLCLTRTNLFFVCTNFWGDVIFWFTSKQLGFRRYQLKSPYTIDIFHSLLVYYLKFHKINNFILFFLGYSRHIKRFIKDLVHKKFLLDSIVRYIPLTYNGCKRKHRRRK